MSIADYSVWLYAEKNNYTLLTGDGKLRKSASKSGVEVCGILKIFDMLVEDYQLYQNRIKQAYRKNYLKSITDFHHVR